MPQNPNNTKSKILSKDDREKSLEEAKIQKNKKLSKAKTEKEKKEIQTEYAKNIVSSGNVHRNSGNIKSVPGTIFQNVKIESINFDEQVFISGKKKRSMSATLMYPKLVVKIGKAEVGGIAVSSRDIREGGEDEWIMRETLPLDFKYNLATGGMDVSKDKDSILRAIPKLYEKNLLFTHEDKREAKILENIMTEGDAESVLIFGHLGTETATGVSIIYGVLDPLKNEDIKIRWLPSEKKGRNKKKEVVPDVPVSSKLSNETYLKISKQIELEAISSKLFSFFMHSLPEGEKHTTEGTEKALRYVSFMFSDIEKTPNPKSPDNTIFRDIMFNEQDPFETQEVRDALHHGYGRFIEAVNSGSPLLALDKIYGKTALPVDLVDVMKQKAISKKKAIIVDFLKSDTDKVGELLDTENKSYYSLYGESKNGHNLLNVEEDELEDVKATAYSSFNFFATDFVHGFSEKYNKLRAITKSVVITDSKFAKDIIWDGKDLAQSRGVTFIHMGNIEEAKKDTKKKEKLIASVSELVADVMFDDNDARSSCTPSVIDGEMFILAATKSGYTMRKEERNFLLGRAYLAAADKLGTAGSSEFVSELIKMSKMKPKDILQEYPFFDDEKQIEKSKVELLASIDDISYNHEKYADVAEYLYASARNDNGFIKDIVGNKIAEIHSTEKQIVEAEKIVTNVSKEKIFRTLTTLSEKEKVFPNLQYINAPKVSLRQITESPILALQYTRFENIAPIIRGAMKDRGLTPPSSAPYEFDIVNADNNILKDGDKDIEIDTKEKNGIVNLKNFPALIKLNTEEAVQNFLETSVSAIMVTLKDDSKELHDLVFEEFESEWRGKLDKASYAILKSQSYMEGTDLVKKEKFVLIDKSLNELEDAVMNVPIFEFSKVLENKKMLYKEQRVTAAKFKSKDINNVFDAMVGNIAKGFKDEPVIFQIIKDNFAKYFTAANKANTKGRFFPVTQEFISKYAKKEIKSGASEIIEKLNKIEVTKDIMADIKANVSIEDSVENAFNKRFKDNAMSAEEIILKQRTVGMLLEAKKHREAEEPITDGFAAKIKETGLSKAMMKFLSEKMLSSRQITNNVFSSVYGKEPLDFKKMNAKEDLKKFIDEVFKDKEHHYYKNDDLTYMTRKIVEENIFKDLDERKELVDVFSDIIAEESVKDFNIQDASLSLINGAAFIDYTIREKKKAIAAGGTDLSASQKANMLQFGLTKVFRLREHQAKLTMGLLALYLSGKISVSNVWWLMRTGKTTTTLATLILIAWTTQSNSAFFIQKKNFIDILSQMFRMWPLALAHNTTALGPNTKYNISEAGAPLAITEWVYKNIPVALRDKVDEKGNSLLRNPIKGSQVSPVEAVAEFFGKDMEILIDRSKRISDEAFFELVEENSELLDYDFCMKDSTIPETDIANILNKAFYFYIVKIIREKYLPAAQEGTVSGIAVKNIHESFWKDYSKEYNLKKRTTGGLVIIGKQFISGFDANEEIENKYKVTGKGNPPTIITDKDIEFYHSVKENPDIVQNIVDRFESSMAIPDFTGEKAIFPSLITGSSESGAKKSRAIHDVIARKAADTLMFTNMTKIEEEIVSLFGEIDEDENLDLLIREIENLYLSVSNIYKGWVEFTLPTTPEAVSVNYLFANSAPAEGVSVDIGFKAEELKQMAEKVEKKGLPDSYLEFYESIASELTNKKVLAKTLSEAMYRFIGTSIINNDVLGNQTAIRRRIGLFSGLVSPKDVSFLYNFTSPVKMLSPIKQKAITAKEKAEKTVRPISLIEIGSSASIASEKDPSYFKNEKVFPKKAYLVVNASGDYYVKYDEVVHYSPLGKEIPFEQKRKQYNTNFASPTMWYFGENTKIKATAIDEMHKTIRGKSRLPIVKLGEAGGYCEKKEYRDLSMFRSYLTGTPYTGNLGIFSDLITTQSSPEMTKLLSRELRKHNGNFKITDQVMAFMIDRSNHTDTLETIFHTTVEKAFTKISKEGSKTNITDIVEEMRSSILDDPKTLKMLVDFSEKNDFPDIPTRGEMIKSFSIIIKDVIKSLSKEIKKITRELQKEEEGKWLSRTGQNKIPPEEKINILNKCTAKAFHQVSFSISAIEDTIINGKTVLSRPAPGLSNLVSMAAITGYTSSNISIKSLHDSMQYITKDSKDNMTDRTKDIPLNEDEKIILDFEDIISKYRKRFSLGTTYLTVRKLLEISTRGLQEHSRALMGITSTEVNDLVNKSKSSKSDSALDFIKDLLVYNQQPPAEKEKAIEIILEGVNYIIENEQDNIKNLRSTLEDGESGTVHIGKGLGVKVSLDELSALVFSFNMAGNPHYLSSYSSATSGAQDNQNRHFLSIKKEGIFMIACDRAGQVEVNQKVLYTTSLKTKPFPMLPAVKSRINITYNDETSLINVAAGITKVKDKLVEHIDKGENTRTMTTRTDITKYSILSTIQAISERKDKKKTHHVLINETSEEISKFSKELMNDSKIVAFLNENKIKLLGVSVSDLETVVEPILSNGGKLHFIGNIASSAEGVNNDYIQIGMFLGSLNEDPNITTQSVARQTGNNQEKSYFYFYGGGGVFHKTTKKSQSSNPILMLESIKKGLDLDIHNANNTKRNLSRFESADAITFGDKTLTTPAIVKHNKSAEINLMASNTFITGNPDYYDLSKASEDEKGTYIADFIKSGKSGVLVETGDKKEKQKDMHGTEAGIAILPVQDTLDESRETMREVLGIVEEIETEIQELMKEKNKKELKSVRNAGAKNPATTANPSAPTRSKP